MIKRLFDLALALLLILAFSWLIFLLWVLASIDTGSNGFFTQERIGLHGKRFSILKIRTMRKDPSHTSTLSLSDDPRITPLGTFLRRTKLDELPQLWNVMIGEMSFVGPRPDVPGYADLLEEPLRGQILSVRPGITGPASLAYRHEEELLAQQADPQTYNDQVIYPDKVRLNIEYIQNQSLWLDLKYIYLTLRHLFVR